ncbi:carbohydrate ABC transporter permease [Labrys sedimenti]|uniref:carbohydrate ABC transporter permease n=1 Tax=Labrys sedimenti TaxID=3106036 RepID=UPI003CD08D8D
MMQRSSIATFFLYCGVALFLVVTLAPVAWLGVMSISLPSDLTAKPLSLVPRHVDFSRYARLLTFEANSPGEAFLMALRNSLLSSLGATALSLLVAVPAGWAFSRYRNRGVSVVLYSILATYMTPAVALILPLYFLLSMLGLLNNVLGLIIVYCSILTPFTAWFIKSSFDAVPGELESAAAIDGASTLQTLWWVTLPYARAGVATAALFAILLAWDEFFYALLFTSNQNAKTLTVTIADFAAGRATDFGLVSAAGLLTALPPVLIAFILQKSLVAGLTAGSVKG